jgi:Holliday junction DNA helicase RuvA
MIGLLSGRLALKKPNLVVVDVQGVGYEVIIPLSSFYPLPDPGADVLLQIYTHVREDALALFGFLTEREKLVFTRLISISGIGPKLAVTILSGIPIDEFIAATQKGDLVKLTSIPGVGKKTAERIVLELKDKMAELAVASEASVLSGVQDDVVSALMNLGYQKQAADKAVKNAMEEGSPEEFEPLLKAALRRLSGEGRK